MNEQRIALVTGGNRGLGRASVLKLAEDGIDVIFTYRSNRDEALKVADTVAAQGRTGVPLELDVEGFGDFPVFAEMVRDALSSRWNRDTFDFLINNAGSAENTPVGATTPDVVDFLVDVHFKGVVLLTQALLPQLADGGRIVNLSTSLTRHVNPGSSVYASVKGAVEVYSKYLASELGQRGIRVNSVAPGPIGTDFGGGALRDDAALREVLAGQAALGRVGEPDDVGGVIAALCGPDTGWMTAQRVEVSGGMNL